MSAKLRWTGWTTSAMNRRLPDREDHAVRRVLHPRTGPAAGAASAPEAYEPHLDVGFTRLSPEDETG
jgi:hypothetical protein